MDRQMMRRGAAVLACLPLLLGFAGCSVKDRVVITDDSHANSAHNSTYMVECLPDNLVQEPSVFAVSCANGTEGLEGLVWQNWGDAEATAVGRLFSVNCNPSCMRGKPISVPVEVTASKLAKREATAIYKKLTVTIVGDVPEGLKRVEIYRLIG